MSCPLHRLLILVSTASIAVVAVVGTTTAAAITTAVSIVPTVVMVMNVLPRMVPAGRVQIVVVAFVYHEAERPALGICLKILICLMANC